MRGAVIVGVVLLIASIIGVKLLMDGSSSNVARARQAAEDAKKRPEYVVCWGHFDVELGVLGLYPKQAGDVVALVGENTKVAKGTVLLQVDDAIAKDKVKEAEADVEAGKQQLEVARLLVQQADLQREQQEASVRAVDAEIKAKALERDTKIKGIDKEQPIRETIEKFFAEGLKQLEEKKKADLAKLEEVKLLKPKAALTIKQVEADLSARETRLRQATEMLKHYKIVALTDGTVLRTHVRKGETLGPNPRSHAVDFLPEGPIMVRAEVMQEWGRWVKPGQEVVIEDDTYNGPKWDGKIKSMSNWYALTRSPVLEPFRYNDIRTLECIIEVTGPHADTRADTEVKTYIGQRVRAKIKIPPQ